MSEDSEQYAYRLLEFKEASDRNVLAGSLAGLHQQLLPHSPVVLLGPRFMQHFYYTLLPQQNFIDGVIAFVNDKPVGFIVTTDDADGFMLNAMRANLLRLCWVMGISVLLQPSRLASLWEAFKIMCSRDSNKTTDRIGELLSFGVLAEYRSGKFSRQSGLKIAHDLLELGLKQVLNTGVARVCALVDQDNTGVKLMYRGLGWVLTKSEIPGWRTPQVEFSMLNTSVTRAE